LCCCYCISEEESDATARLLHFSANIALDVNDEAMNEKQYTVINDKEARGITYCINLFSATTFTSVIAVHIKIGIMPNFKFEFCNSPLPLCFVIATRMNEF